MKENKENDIISGTGKIILIAIGAFVLIELLILWEVISK